MSKYKNYEAVKTQLESLKEKVLLSAFIESVVESKKINVGEIDEVLEEMSLSKEIVIDGEDLYYIDNVKYGIGSFRVVRETFAFAETISDSFYIGKDDFNGALDMDDVLFEIKSNEKRFGVVIKSVKRNRDVILGTMKKDGKKLFFIPYDNKITFKVEYDASNLDLKENDRCIGRITSVGERIHVDIISVLGQADEPGMDVLSVLFVYGIDNDFKQEVLDEIKNVPTEIDQNETKHRMDHRDQYVITIDGEDAKDLDDAIYMEALNGGYRLYVHIADVGHYVQPQTALDQSAYERSSSVYMVDRVVPMLPKELSNGICSLHPNVDRLTMTCQIDISYAGEVIDYNIYESVICSKRRMSYKEINTSPDLGEVQEMVSMMLDCARRLQYKRNQAGQIGFDSAESQFVIDHEGNVLDIFLRERGEAEEMIESFMVIANEVVAQHCRYQSIPVLYRVHEAPDREKMQELSHTLRILGYRLKGNLEEIRPKEIQKALKFFEGKPEYPVVSRLMLRSMTKAKYSQEPLGHFGLALEDYTHFTSPIRRYPDLLLHQRIKQYAVKHDFSKLEKDEQFTIEAGLHVSKKERSILDAERQVEKIKKAQFMSNKIGEEYVGFISGISNFGIFVELPNTVEGLIHVRNLNDDFYTFDGPSQKMIGERTGRTYSIGQKLKVKLVSVDDLEHVVNFEIIGQKKMSRRKPDSRKDGFKSKDRPSESRNTDKRKGRRINDRRRKKS